MVGVGTRATCYHQPCTKCEATLRGFQVVLAAEVDDVVPGARTCSTVYSYIGIYRKLKVETEYGGIVIGSSASGNINFRAAVEAYLLFFFQRV